MTTKIIGLCGYKGAGKDTLGKALCDHYGFTRFAFADAIKDVLYDLNPRLGQHMDLRSRVDEIGWDRAKEFKHVRDLLKRLGVSMRVNVDKDVWVRPVVEEASLSRHPVVITDVRFDNEVSAIRRKGGKIVLVEREGCESDGHASETLPERVEPDATFFNNHPRSSVPDHAHLLLYTLGYKALADPAT